MHQRNLTTETSHKWRKLLAKHEKRKPKPPKRTTTVKGYPTKAYIVWLHNIQIWEQNKMFLALAAVEASEITLKYEPGPKFRCWR